MTATTSTYIAAAAGAFTVLVGAVSFAGSVVTFAKLQELMTTRPVVFPGGPLLMAGTSVAAVGVAVGVVVDAHDSRVHPWLLVLLAVLALAVGRAVRAAGRRRRRTDRHLAAQRVHRPHRRGERLRARQRAAAGGRHPGRGERHDPDPDDGRRDGPLDGEHPVRRVQGRLDGRVDRGERPAGALGERRGRRDPAGLRAQGRDRPRLRARGRAGPAHHPRAGRGAGGQGRAGRSTASTRSPAGCPAT